MVLQNKHFMKRFGHLLVLPSNEFHTQYKYIIQHIKRKSCQYCYLFINIAMEQKRVTFKLENIYFSNDLSENLHKISGAISSLCLIFFSLAKYA